jgi:hypothetical protein
MGLMIGATISEIYIYKQVWLEQWCNIVKSCKNRRSVFLVERFYTDGWMTSGIYNRLSPMDMVDEWIK